MIPVLLTGYLIAVNRITYLAFRSDKYRAAKGQWRISEQSLLMLALCGGWIGAKRAQSRYRHKTRKQPFAAILNIIPVVWGGAALLFVASAEMTEWSWLVSFDAADPFRITDQTSQRPTPRFFKSVDF